MCGVFMFLYSYPMAVCRVTKIDDYEMMQLRLPRYIGPDQVRCVLGA